MSEHHTQLRRQLNTVQAAREQLATAFGEHDKLVSLEERDQLLHTLDAWVERICNAIDSCDHCNWILINKDGAVSTYSGNEHEVNELVKELIARGAWFRVCGPYTSLDTTITIEQFESGVRPVWAESEP